VPHLVLYLVEQRLRFYSRSRIIGDGTVDKKMTILQMNRYVLYIVLKRYIYIYIYIVSSTMYVERCVSVYGRSYNMKPEENVEHVT
jgi:hypothetical protein